MSDEDADITQLDDPAFLGERARVRELFERLPSDHADRGRLAARYSAMQAEFLRRASISRTGAGRSMNDTTRAAIPPPRWARLLAVEVLLADPEGLGNDALEGDLYILRDRLREEDPASP